MSELNEAIELVGYLSIDTFLNSYVALFIIYLERLFI